MRARAGDPAAFEQLVKRYKAPLYNYLVRMTSSRTDAEDLFQETFLRLYRSLHLFHEGAAFRPWLYKIATNLCHDYWRSWRRRVRLFVTRTDDATPVEEAPSGAPDPRRLAEDSEWGERLAAAVARLTLPHRTVFLLARYHDMTYKEIGESLEIPEGTVKSRMNKAVHQLMRDLGEEP